MLKRKSLADKKVLQEIIDKLDGEYSLEQVEKAWRTIFEKASDAVSDGSASRVRLPFIGELKPNLSAIDAITHKLKSPKRSAASRARLEEFRENVKKHWGLNGESA